MDFSHGLPAYGSECSQCTRTFIVLEALFSRIHFLEAQAAQHSADKDAANRTLYHLIHLQPSIVNTNRPSSSVATSGGSESSTSPPRQNVTGHATKADASTQGKELLIDLLGPLENPIERPDENSHSSQETEFQSFNPTTSKDAHVSVPSVVKTGNHHHDATDFSASNAHIRRFPKKMNESTVVKEVTTHVEATTQSQHANRVGCTLTPTGELSYSSSDDSDNHNYTSLNTSFSEDQEPFTAQTEAIEEGLRKVASRPSSAVKNFNHKQRYGLEHSIWARQEMRAFPILLSPDERWERYCEDIVVKVTGSVNEEPMNQSSPNPSNSATSEPDGELARLNQFRFSDTCGICFNPHGSIEHDSYRTVIISGLPVDCTMTNVLNEVRGGLILEARSLDTMTITRSKSIMLTFVEGTAATSLETHAKRYGFSVQGQQAHVSIVRTPTTPISKKVRNGIKTSYHTRCLDVRNFPRSISPQALRYDLRPLKASTLDFIESMNMNDEGVLELRFLSIDAAADAFSFLMARHVNVKHHRCRVDYGEDPCMQPWVEKDSTSMDTVMMLDDETETSKLSAKEGEGERIITDSMSAEDIDIDGLVIGDADLIEDTKIAEELRWTAMDEA